jgi:hypothetical protein
MRIFLCSLLAVAGLAAQIPALRPAAVAPIPADPRELAGANVQTPATPDERAAVLALLERARQHSDMHIPGSPPFRLKLQFNAGGDVSFTGAGEISELWMSGRSWRYDQNLSSYSQVRIGQFGQMFDQKPASALPLRVHMLRSAFFWPVAGNPSTAALRTAAAEWNGKPVTCLLFSRGGLPASESRHWEEREFCVDNSSGLLQIFSEAPGTYVVYGYSKNIDFHGRRLPDQIVAYVGGAAVLDSQLVSIEDASASPEELSPADGTVPWEPATPVDLARYPRQVPNAQTSGVVKPVIVHAMVNAKGMVSEAEISATSDNTLSQAAIDLVKSTVFPSGRLRELYVNVRFLPGP